MSNDPATPPTPPPDSFKPPASQAELDQIVESRLARERAKFADYDAVRAKAEQFDALEAKNKTDLERANDQAATEKQRADAAEAKLLRISVAGEKKLTPAQAEFLSGATREEIEAHADRLLQAFPSAAGDGTGGEDPEGGNQPSSTQPSPTGRPVEQLRGGSDTTQTAPADMRSVVAAIPRGF